MKTLPVLDPNAAAIDVGSEQLHLSIAGDAPVVFGTFTDEVYRLRDYLQAQAVTSVAMEATGVYWLYAYAVLEAAGLEVVVVNGRHVRNLPGRKTDMADCQWLATLHAHGLLRGGFVPPAAIRRLQDYQRLRADHIIGAGSQVQMEGYPEFRATATLTWRKDGWGAGLFVNHVGSVYDTGPAQVNAWV